MTIIIDTREQRPWSFREDINIIYGTLKTGDYALDGDDSFAIERKSMDDFLGTISSGWERFQREIERMAEFSAKVIIVEGDYREVCYASDMTLAHSHWRLSPQFVMKRIAELTMMGCSVLFACDRELAAGLATSILIQRKYELDKNRNATNSELQTGQNR